MPWGDDARRFLERVHNWPASDSDAGLVNIHSTWKNPTQGRDPYWTGRAFRDPAQAVSYASWLIQQPAVLNIYHCTSLQAQTARKNNKIVALRSIQNTISSKVLFLDIDVKTPPKGYINTNEALTEFKKFLHHWKLPFPSAIVLSGSGGFHSYWISNRPLTHVEWLPLAESLRSAAVQFGLRFDKQCTVDMARVLRLPETSNYKTTPPGVVKLLHLDPDDLDFDTQLKPVLDLVPVTLPTPVAPLPVISSTVERLFDPKLFSKRIIPAVYTGVAGEASAGVDNDAPPLNTMAVIKGCGFLREALFTGGKDYDQPLWMLSVLAASFLSDGRALAHKLSKDHPKYDPDDTDSMYDRKEREKVSKDMGWPGCMAIEQAGCSSCALCPHHGKIKSPLNLGLTSEPKQVTVPGNSSGFEPTRDGLQSWPIPLPDGYTFDNNGYICKIISIKEKTADGVEESTALIPLLYEQRIFQPWLQHDPDALNFTVEGNLEGLRKVFIEREYFNSQSDTIKILGRQGVAPNPPMIPDIGRFLMIFTRKLEMAKKAAPAKPLGWIESVAKGDSDAFVYGGNVFYRDGREGPGGYLDTRIAEQYTPVGSREPWLTAAEFIIQQNRYENIVMLATAFGAPLMEFTDQHTGVYSVFGATGIGKSTALKIAAAVWGHPNDSRLTQGSTENHVGHKMGALSNLPVYMDELSDDKAQGGLHKQIMQDGKEKERLIARSGIPLSVRVSGTWSTMVGSTSNRSFLAYISDIQRDTDSGRARVFEVRSTAGGATGIGRWEVDRMLHNLRGNFGLIGREYAKFLAMNSEGMRQKIIDRGILFDNKVRALQPERFWSTFCTCILIGAEFARDNGWVNFDLAKVEEFLIEAYLDQRSQMADSGQDNEDATVELITAFIKEHFQHILVTDDFPTQAGRMLKPFNVMRQPMQQQSKGIHIQYVDRPVNPVLMISRNHLNEFLLKTGHQASVVMARIPHKITKVTLGRNTMHAAGSERIYEIDIVPNSWIHNVMRDLYGAPSNGKPAVA